MNLSNFEISIKESKNLLKKTYFFKEIGVKSINNEGVSDAFIKASYKSNYFDAYKAGIENKDYDILLIDNSFFQFEFKQNANHFPLVRFAFFQNPQLYISYEDYLNILRQDGIIEIETNDEIGDSLTEEYEQFLLEQEMNPLTTTIRYDVDITAYKPLVHSTAHLHIGHSNNIRIPCDKILTPLNFVLFVLKHTYYSEWKILLKKNNKELEEAIKRAKKSCTKIVGKYWLTGEQDELFLT